MTYLTTDHAMPQPHILADGLRHPVAPLIRREDIHRLSQLGVLRHITAEGPAPLGYGPWQLSEDAQGPHYYREPAGTQEEIQTALDAQAAAEQRAQWATQAQARRTREARKTLAEPTTEQNLDRKLDALQFIQEV
jgi:hypothetical protein